MIRFFIAAFAALVFVDYASAEERVDTITTAAVFDTTAKPSFKGTFRAPSEFLAYCEESPAEALCEGSRNFSFNENYWNLARKWPGSLNGMVTPDGVEAPELPPLPLFTELGLNVEDTCARRRANFLYYIKGVPASAMSFAVIVTADGKRDTALLVENEVFTMVLGCSLLKWQALRFTQFEEEGHKILYSSDGPGAHSTWLVGA